MVRAGHLQSADIRRTRPLCQGGPDAPKVFNLILDDDLIWFHNYCQDRKWGVDIGEFFLSVLCFADNFWIIATSADMLQDMFTAFLDRLESSGWIVPLKECSWSTTAADDTPFQILVRDTAVERTSRHEGFKV